MSKTTALTEHAVTHLRQPEHISSCKITPPPGLSFNALTGQAPLHAGSLQPRQTMATKRLAIPPVVRILIALLSIE